MSRIDRPIRLRPSSLDKRDSARRTPQHRRRLNIGIRSICNGAVYSQWWHLHGLSARIFSCEFGFEAVAVGSATPDHGVLHYYPIFPAISLPQLAAEISANDVLIANPSFSKHHFGLTLPGRKLMYVQAFNTFSLLDCRFHRYVAVSNVVQRLLSGVYHIDAPVIPAFIGDSAPVQRLAWCDRRHQSIIVSPKSPQIYIDRLYECLAERGVVVEFHFFANREGSSDRYAAHDQRLSILSNTLPS